MSGLALTAGVDLEALAVSGSRVEQATARWLMGRRSAHTRVGYLADLRLWLAYCTGEDVHPLAATRGHVDAWVYAMAGAATRLGRPPAESTVARRLSVVASWYDYLIDVGLRRDRNPVHPSSRPSVDADTSTTVGLTTEEARAFRRALDAPAGTGGYLEPARIRAALHLMLTDGLRLSEANTATVASLGYARGHTTIRVHGKGRKPRTLPLPPPVVDAIQAVLAEAATRLGVPTTELPADTPLVTGRDGGPLTDKSAARAIRRVARRAGITSWASLSAHSLRHTSATAALDAGAPLRDVQDMLGHADPRTTRRYDRSRGALDRSPAYLIAAALADDGDNP